MVLVGTEDVAEAMTSADLETGAYMEQCMKGICSSALPPFFVIFYFFIWCNFFNLVYWGTPRVCVYVCVCVCSSSSSSSSSSNTAVSSAKGRHVRKACAVTLSSVAISAFKSFKILKKK